MNAKQRKTYNKEYYKNNKERILIQKKEYLQKPKVKERKKDYGKKWRENNQDKIKKDNNKNKEKRKEYNQRLEVKTRMKEYRQRLNIKERQKESDSIYYKKNKDKILKHRKDNYQKNRNRELKNKKDYYENNKERILIQKKEYLQKPEVKAKRNSNYKQRREIDKNFLIQTNIRSAFRKALKKYSITGKIMPSSKYGVNYKKIIKHLKPFPKNRENYHVDHIIPLSWFNHNDKKEISWAWAPENHQWMLKEDNLKKGDSYILVNELGFTK